MHHLGIHRWGGVCVTVVTDGDPFMQFFLFAVPNFYNCKQGSYGSLGSLRRGGGPS
jgi:hypothetical protein